MTDNCLEFLQQLREQTAASHRSLEALPVSSSIMSPEVNLRHYTDYLQLLYGFIAVLEKSVYPFLSELVPDVEQRRKTSVLHDNLVDLGINTKQVQLIQEPVFSVYTGHVFFALGGMYVMEGSTLGGQIIARHLDKKLGTSVAGKLQYIQGYGPSTGTMWKSFLSFFCQANTSASAADEIIRGAIYTFQLLEKWLSGNQPIIDR